jgi:hypothetical protein
MFDVQGRDGILAPGNNKQMKGRNSGSAFQKPGNNNVRRCLGSQIISPELRMFYASPALKTITGN